MVQSHFGQLQVWRALGRCAAMMCCALSAMFSFGAEKSTNKVGIGTAKMAARLAEIDRRTDPMNCFYLSDRRVPLLRAQLPLVTNILEKIYLRGTLGLELLNSAEPEEALIEFEKCIELGNSAPGGQAPKFYREMDRFMGMCHLRQGELDNCVAFHG